MARTGLADERTGARYDYSRVHPNEVLVADLGVTLPEHAPERYRDRATLWNEVEAAEKRADAQVCRKIMIPLPDELDEEHAVALALRIVADRAADGHTVDACMHSNADGTNMHLHMMEPMRPTDDNGLLPKSENAYLVRDAAGDEASLNARELKAELAAGRSWEKVYLYKVGKSREQLTRSQAEARGLDPVKDRVRRQPVQTTRYLTDWTGPDRYEEWRAQWAARMNEALEAARCDARVDHRSYERQGVDRLPQRHEGPRVRAVERRAEREALEDGRGYEPVTDVRRDNVERARLNAALEDVRKRVAAIDELVRRRAREAVLDARRALLAAIRHPERSIGGQARESIRKRDAKRRRAERARRAWARWEREDGRVQPAQARGAPMRIEPALAPEQARRIGRGGR